MFLETVHDVDDIIMMAMATTRNNTSYVKYSVLVLMVKATSNRATMVKAIGNKRLQDKLIALDLLPETPRVSCVVQCVGSTGGSYQPAR